MSLSAVSEMSDYKSVSLWGRAQNLMRPMRWYRRRMMRKPGSTTALSFASLLGVVIITNAVALQTERHPTPIFTPLSVSEPENRAVPAAAPAAAQAAAPARRQPTERRAEAAVPVPPVAPARDVAKPATRGMKEEPQRTASIPTQPRDQIGALISSTEDDVPDASRRILQVQKALNKAGFGPVRESGLFGNATRQALEKFETAKKLPVRGEMQGKTLRELARVSGVAID